MDGEDFAVELFDLGYQSLITDASKCAGSDSPNAEVTVLGNGGIELRVELLLV